MGNSNAAKAAALGMSYGMANARLRKAIMFAMAVRLGEDRCYRCGGRIDSIDDLSIEHKVPWQKAADPVGVFFDLTNVAFSHLSCNAGARSGDRVWSNPQEASRVVSRRRQADSKINDHDKLVRRQAYARGDNPNRAVVSRKE